MLVVMLISHCRLMMMGSQTAFWFLLLKIGWFDYYYFSLKTVDCVVADTVVEG